MFSSVVCYTDLWGLSTHKDCMAYGYSWLNESSYPFSTKTCIIIVIIIIVFIVIINTIIIIIIIVMIFIIIIIIVIIVISIIIIVTIIVIIIIINIIIIMLLPYCICCNYHSVCTSLFDSTLCVNIFWK